MAKGKKKSPLKSAPLRNPGQSLDEQINDLWDKGTQYFIFAMGYLVIAAYDWIRWLGLAPKNPYTGTVFASVVIGYCVYRIVRIRKEIERLRLARDGEKVVGQYLEQLREAGARVLHDIVGDGFNVDHLVISEHGIFVIDTKTYSKPMRGEAKVTLRGGEVYVNGAKIERNPIKQVKSLAQWVGELIEQSTGRKYPVQPVVVFPGWYVEKVRHGQEVWVLNPKALPTFIQNNPKMISFEDMRLIFYHLSRYVRSLSQ